MKRPSYFSLYEIALLSLFGALVFVLRAAIVVPILTPGSSGVFWFCRSSSAPPSCGNRGPERMPDWYRILARSSASTAPCLRHLSTPQWGSRSTRLHSVRYRLDNPLVGFIAGAAGNVVRWW